MATTTKSENGAPHVALLPCAGMGHLVPFLRLAAMLDSHGAAVTLITVKPTVSAAESEHLASFFSIYPQIKRLEFQLLPYKNSGFTNDDPFLRQWESVGNSVHLLHPLLSSLSPPLSAIFADFVVTSRLSQLASHLSLPIYTLITTSATFFSLITHLPQLLQAQDDGTRTCIDVPALGPIPLSSIPPPMLDRNHFFATIASNASSLHKSKGVIINTFTSFESEAIEALSRNGLKHILPVGPLEFHETEKTLHNLPWLDEQAAGSVLFISFGSRTALTKDQLRELGAALEKTGCAFLWALKGSKVDKEDNEDVEDMLGASFLEKTRERGVIIKGWADQEKILEHPSIAGFVSHCGWNSVIEAATLGVPILAWPTHGDQRINAEVVEKAGLGLWVREWGWGGERLIDREEIAEKLVELMQDEDLRDRAKEAKAKAKEAKEINGTLLRGLIESLKIKET